MKALIKVFIVVFLIMFLIPMLFVIAGEWAWHRCLQVAISATYCSLWCLFCCLSFS